MIFLDKLDLIFPFVVLAYGATVTLVMSSTRLVDRAEQAFPDAVVQQLKAHRILAQVCLVVGLAWSLQTLCL